MNPNKIRVIIADDHHCVRQGLVALLDRETDIEVVAEARDGMELIRLAREWRPDVLLVDLFMPCMNGLEAIRNLRGGEPLACRSLCLSMQSDPRQVQAALDAGASGFVLKDNSFDELARGVRRVHAGQIYLSGELMGQMLAYGGAAPAPDPTVQRLTPRERQMVQLLAEGYSTQQIADHLHLSAKTVATHREHVFAKLQIQGIAQLTRFALRAGLSSLEARGP
jgi:DNA-binding NarL/FixJ family response regulator